MNGPFYIESWGSYVRDDSGNTVADGHGEDDASARKNAEMVCAALNAAYYFAKATGEHQ